MAIAAEELSQEAIVPRLRTQLIGRRYVYLPVTSSTQDVAKELASQGTPEGTVVVANEQTMGRGRLQRTFLTPAGASLALSVVLKPAREHLTSLMMLSALAVARAIEKTTGLRAAIKWPNDVLVRDRKVSGVLVESELQGEQVAFAIVGIGLNVNLRVADYPEIADIATSLAAELGRPVSRADVLLSVLDELEAYYTALRRGESIYLEWHDRLALLGRQVRVTMGQEVEEGVAEDVSPDGALILRRADGSRVQIVAGDVTLRQ